MTTKPEPIRGSIWILEYDFQKVLYKEYIKSYYVTPGGLAKYDGSHGWPDGVPQDALNQFMYDGKQNKARTKQARALMFSTKENLQKNRFRFLVRIIRTQRREINRVRERIAAQQQQAMQTVLGDALKDTKFDERIKSGMEQLGIKPKS